MEKCKCADRYKGVRKPQCNHGDPCDACKCKYSEKHPNMFICDECLKYEEFALEETHTGHNFNHFLCKDCEKKYKD